MMKRLRATERLCIFLSFLSGSVVAQQLPDEYYSLTSEAFKLSRNGEHCVAASQYERAFVLSKNSALLTDRYNAACAWALCGRPDSAILHIEAIIRNKPATFAHLTEDKDLSSLHSHSRWPAIAEAISSAKNRADTLKKIKIILESIYREDQELRLRINAERKTGELTSKKEMEIWRLISQKDSSNLVMVKHIINTYGWLGPDEVGSYASSAIFLVIQHADLSTQEQYVPMMREAAKLGKASTSSLALLEDRIAVRNGRKQLYGSQVWTDTVSGKSFPYPLEDPEHVDEKRSEMKLGPIADYLKHWDMKWDLDFYYSQLPALEKQLDKIGNARQKNSSK